MILDAFSLEGKVAIVTGASRGIGRAIALGFAQAGADVVGVSRSDTSSLKAEIEAMGRRYLNLAIDVSEADAPDRIVNESVEAFGKIHILVNNAGTTRRCPSIDFTEEDWDAVLAVNLKPVFFISQRAARQFIKQGTGGKIINIASMTSYEGGLKVVPYTASKSAVRNITMNMCNEWAKDGVYANAIAPGYTTTDLTAPMRGESHRVAETMTRIPMGRWADPEEMVGPAVFLASEASNYVNGFTLAVDGGYLGR